MATSNYGWTELDLDDEANIGQVNTPLNQIDSTLKQQNDSRDGYHNAAWTPYTPSWQTQGSNLQIENGTLTGRWRRIGTGAGRLVVGSIRLVRGSNTNKGNGVYDFGLPVRARDFSMLAGSGWTRDNSAGKEYPLIVRGNSPGQFRTMIGDGSAFSNTNPYTPDTDDQIVLNFWYEAQ